MDLSNAPSPKSVCRAFPCGSSFQETVNVAALFVLIMDLYPDCIPQSAGGLLANSWSITYGRSTATVSKVSVIIDVLPLFPYCLELSSSFSFLAQHFAASPTFNVITLLRRLGF